MKSQAEMFIDRSAIFHNADGNSRWRYMLGRFWVPKGERTNLALWIMLNPSTADALKDDPTIRKCMEFSRRWGYGGCVIANLFAYRSTDPKGLRSTGDPIGPNNDAMLKGAIEFEPYKLIICAWGRHGSFMGRDQQVKDMIENAKMKAVCLGTNSDGSPKHPLYIPYSTELKRYA